MLLRGRLAVEYDIFAHVISGIHPYPPISAMATIGRKRFVVASRSSKLAQVQTNLVISSLDALYASHPADSRPQFESNFMSTELGDRNKSDPLYLLGAKAIWTKDLETALLNGEVDMLVHSFKDVPTTLPQGCTIGAVSERSDPVDALVIKAGKQDVWKTLDDLPSGSVVGTSSVRRVAQLTRQYPKLQFLDVVCLSWWDYSLYL